MIKALSLYQKISIIYHMKDISYLLLESQIIQFSFKKDFYQSDILYLITYIILQYPPYDAVVVIGHRKEVRCPTRYPTGYPTLCHKIFW